MTIWFATGNVHKQQELAAILENSTIKIPAGAGIKFDPNENGSSFIENSLIKARELQRLLAEQNIHDPVIADDSGICVDVLGGRPGVHSARYGNEGRYSNEWGKKLEAPERNALLLKEMGDSANRRARFVCAMTLLFSKDRFFAVQETLEGEIVKDPGESRGQGGFGYDPILYIPGLGRTVAELTEEEKNKISHRGKAARAIAVFLRG
jgi:XTP/dITP diphosphohydrolase